jgi:predicted oxidoreductase (fatty acid repression mutant protein)
MSAAITQAFAKRRTIYDLGAKIAITPAAVEDIVKRCVKEAPSAFNSQSARVIVLFNEESKKHWRIIETALRKIVPAEKFEPTEKKLREFAAGAGTILFFDDQAVIEGLQKQFPAYAGNFPTWGQQANGMLQFAIWTALAAEGIGASLQHYVGVDDEGIGAACEAPGKWQLIAAMPFGSIGTAAGEKETAAMEERVKVLGV